MYSANINLSSSTKYFIILSKFNIIILGQEDIKIYVEERTDDLDKMGRLSRVELFQLHVLIEQASYEIRQKRPEVSISNNETYCYTRRRNITFQDTILIYTIIFFNFICVLFC